MKIPRQNHASSLYFSAYFTGEVRGSLEAAFYGRRYFAQFLGLPYAQPPLGALRFASPQPLAKGTLGPRCLVIYKRESKIGIIE